MGDNLHHASASWLNTSLRNSPLTFFARSSCRSIFLFSRILFTSNVKCMPHVLVQLHYFSLLEEEQFLCVKPTRVTQICKVREGYSFQQQHLCTESFTQEPQEVQPGEVQIPALGRKPPGNWYMLWATQVESSLAEKGLGSCQCVLVARTMKCTPGCIRRGIASRSEG